MEEVLEVNSNGMLPEKEITRQVSPWEGETNQVIIEDVVTSNESECNTHLVEQTSPEVEVLPESANPYGLT
ncbi:hypothetical protein F8M41_005214 [Gigaspora margarita]|uniref:Uncharacterized protein n=1 Tax=Gigaspora margarita TaxID=4874 RepID=A0A8H3X8G9_GIGMA|nr:hypothetical protein F8M41_005214 [Gigaspora margarita]